MVTVNVQREKLEFQINVDNTILFLNMGMHNMYSWVTDLSFIFEKLKNLNKISFINLRVWIIFWVHSGCLNVSRGLK